MTQPRDLKAVQLKNLSLEDTIYCHLSSRVERTNDFYLWSTLDLVEQEMRQARGTQRTANYAPLLTAFALLDQIGSCYRDKTLAAHPHAGSSIHRALYFFGNMPAMSPEVKALYALRNGLFHDASLTCKTNAGDWYFFRYSPSLQTPIELPPVMWDGTASNVGPKITTWVNPRLFTEVVSTSINNVRDCFEKRRHDLEVLQGKTDILHKYLLWDGIPPDQRV